MIFIFQMHVLNKAVAILKQREFSDMNQTFQYANVRWASASITATLTWQITRKTRQPEQAPRQFKLILCTNPNS